MLGISNQRIQFVAAISVGVVVAFALLPWAHDAACMSMQQNAIVPNQIGATEQHQNQSNATIESKIENSSDYQKTSAQINPEHWPKSLLCGEMKFTDLALAFFTYTLAIVGWFTLRSGEQTAEAVERAYVFPGYDPLVFDDGRAKFKLVMTNTGRMPAGVKEVGYAFLKRRELPKRREDADWTWTIISYDWVVPAVTQTQISSRKEIKEMESPYAEANIFVCYIKYEDFFSKRRHISWMGMHIFPAHTESERASSRAGGDIWNDWD